MAGEVFIARQDTLEAVKGTVDGIDSGVKQTNNALGNFSGGGTDTVKKELQTLKDSVAQLQTKSDQLQSLIEQLMNKGGGLNFKYTGHKTGNFSYTTTSSGIVLGYVKGGYESTTPSISLTGGAIAEFKLLGCESYKAAYTAVGFFQKGATITGEEDGSKDTVTADIFEFI